MYKVANKNNPENVRKVYVTPDLTPQEQQHNKVLRNQLAEMNKGENKYWIKKQQDCAEGKLSTTLCSEHTLGSGCEDSDIKCLLTNTRSIMNKFEELCNYVDQYKPYIIDITETWSTNLINDAELYLKGYNLFHCDRKNSHGGGVLLNVHTSLYAVTCESLTRLINIEDSVWCMVALHGCEKLLIGVVHRAPSSSSENDNELIRALNNIEDYHDCSDHDLLIMGDFNAPNVVLMVRMSSFSYKLINATLDSYLT